MPGTSDKILKWKPCELITCDFGVVVQEWDDHNKVPISATLQIMADGA